MKPRLIMLSDLWGKEKSFWVADYVEKLKNYFEIQYYDCRELGGIATMDFDEESLHAQFVNGGIERAVSNLQKLEKEEIHILAFSVGGTIGWKYALKNANVKSITAVSSTRLRYETQKPKSDINLYFGANDNYKPEKDWFERLQIEMYFEQNKGHLVYTDKNFIDKLCSMIKESHTQINDDFQG